MSLPDAPLLRPRQPSQPSSLSLLLSRAVSTARRRGGASVLVRETAAVELEERRADWGYSKPVVALDVMWNLSLVAVSAVVLFCTAEENPNVPIRLWICGYAIQCLVHVVLVWAEYKRRNLELVEVDIDGRIRVSGIGNQSRIMKRCESVNSMASFLWWILGFNWVVSGGELLLTSAPRLYWLSVVFLAFDVFFTVFCVVLACLIGIALCCCLPCIITLLYAIAGQDGASESDLIILSKYKFQSNETCRNEDRLGFSGGRMVPVKTSNGLMANERVLLPEDTECCICLCPYEDGTELDVLPCNHHFHSTCIVKWLKMNATCPLCKFNILEGNEQV